MIVIDSLSHVYPGSRKQPPRRALHDLTLHIGEGEFVILSGPNGSGKSSLFRILCGATRPSAGQVRLDGFNLARDLAQIRRILGVVFQNPAIDKQLSIAENLQIHADLYGLSARDFRARRDEALAWTDLTERLGDRVETLSGGLARQVELAKVLMTRPKILLLDEPTTGLDPASRRNFLAALHRLQHERGMTVLMTSHIFTEADDVDRVAILCDGVLLAYDSPQALKSRIGTEMVVIQPHDPDAFAAKLRAELDVSVRRHGDEVRLEETENGESLPLLSRILDRWRNEIRAIAIKQPDLEDVFVHVTGRSVPPDQTSQTTLPHRRIAR